MIFFLLVFLAAPHTTFSSCTSFNCTTCQILKKAKNMKYFVKIKKFPYTVIDDEVLNADCVPILNTPEKQLYKLELETEKIMTQQLPVHPPWKKSSINICIRDWPNKQTTLPLELKNNFLHHRDEKHAGEIQIYTDGSKMEMALPLQPQHTIPSS